MGREVAEDWWASLWLVVTTFCVSATFCQRDDSISPNSFFLYVMLYIAAHSRILSN